MIDPATNLSLGNVTGGALSVGKTGSAPSAGGVSFSDTLKQSINEVSKLQSDASRAVQDLATGQTDNVAGVFSAMEKADVAFKTLLAIRAKLMDAYDEIKNIQV